MNVNVDRNIVAPYEIAFVYIFDPELIAIHFGDDIFYDIFARLNDDLLYRIFLENKVDIIFYKDAFKFRKLPGFGSNIARPFKTIARVFLFAHPHWKRKQYQQVWSYFFHFKISILIHTPHILLGRNVFLKKH